MRVCVRDCNKKSDISRSVIARSMTHLKCLGCDTIGIVSSLRLFGAKLPIRKRNNLYQHQLTDNITQHASHQ